MKKLLFFLLLIPGLLKAQLLSPDEFLGYKLGSRFTPHARVLAYFDYVTARSERTKLLHYGQSYEGRELVAAIISSRDNIANIDQIRLANLAATGLGGRERVKKRPGILWLSYNVHGNEASSTETAMQVLYTLASGKDQTAQWLENTIVLLDPCLNPDGRERFVSWYTSVAGSAPDPDPAAREHHEPWPGGRSNHYYFDLNRDWAWQSQKETRARLALYNQWMPQVHVDFHEQGYNEPYYFAPAAEPVHRDISSWQREFQVIAGKHNAKYFDEKGWQYFTKERFDLLYPSYGDTYPLYNGAIGMTYEQGGIGAGLSVKTSDGNILTLADRIAHHFTTSIATLEIVSATSAQLLDEFGKYFTTVRQRKVAFRSFVVKGTEPGAIRALTRLLDANRIRYKFGGKGSAVGLSFESGKSTRFEMGRNDLIINTDQPKSVLVSVLFEPQTFLTDSNTYDITAWALPYAFSLSAFAVKERLEGVYAKAADISGAVSLSEKSYAWAFDFTDPGDIRTVTALQREGIKMRIADDDFTIGERAFHKGSLLVYRSENEKHPKLVYVLKAAAALNGKQFVNIPSGFAAKGRDLGSSPYRMMREPKVAVLSGPETSAQNLGSIWHLAEEELGFPLTILNPAALKGEVDLRNFNTIIIPDGQYSMLPLDALASWAMAGGRLILLGGALQAVVDKKTFAIREKRVSESVEPSNLKKYSEKENFADAIPGAIYSLNLDKTHPLSFGMSNGLYYVIKTDDKIFEYLKDGYNVGTVGKLNYRSGLVGSRVRRHLQDGLLLGIQPLGRGEVYYFADDPLFRAFWYSGKRVFINALYF